MAKRRGIAVYLNGEKLPVHAIYMGGQCYLPVRAVGEALQGRVSYEPRTDSVRLETKLRLAKTGDWFLQVPRNAKVDFYLDLTDRDLLKDLRLIAERMSPAIDSMAPQGKVQDKQQRELAIGIVAGMIKGADQGGSLLGKVNHIGALVFSLEDEEVHARIFQERKQAVEQKGWRLVAASRFSYHGDQGEFRIYVLGDRQGIYALVNMPDPDVWKLAEFHMDGFFDLTNLLMNLTTGEKDSKPEDSVKKE